MPRSTRPNGVEPKKRRSRTGCWPCKARKVKCGEEKPHCLNCIQHSSGCDYSIRLNWGGRPKNAREDSFKWDTQSVVDSSSTIVFPTAEELTGHGPPSLTRTMFVDVPKTSEKQRTPSHRNSYHRSNDSQQEALSPRNGSTENSSVHAYAQSLGTLSPGNDSVSRFSRDGSTPLGTPMSNDRMQLAITSSPRNVDNHSSRVENGYPPLSHIRPASTDAMNYDSVTYNPTATTLSPFAAHSSLQSPSFNNHITTMASQSDPRRLSVYSLLVDPEDINTRNISSYSRYPLTSVAEESTTYGYDLGYPDLDTPRNDDLGAILPYSPPTRRESVLAYLNANGEMERDDSPFNPFSASSKVTAFERGGYYATPVPIKIPFAFEKPLPSKLLENKMNLLYFHHFLNHTARILVPHDCSLNPFRTVLPEMAVRDESLMNLLLAYSASHRARLLHHPEPDNRIAVYVQEVFPKLREALTADHPINISTLATAIMLASLEILSPGSFGVGVPWNHHLSIARQIIVARGGTEAIYRSDRYSYFLIRWFAYLDIMGSLCGRTYPSPLSLTYWKDDESPTSGLDHIDCLLGFSTECVRLLARVSHLCKECEAERLDMDGNVNELWLPRPELAAQAKLLKLDIRQARTRDFQACPYGDPEAEDEVGWNALGATNEMFHWAALIHLNRRVLNVALDDPEVQNAVQEIVSGLFKIRPGSTAEANILNPLFIAGAHALDFDQRERIMGRLKVVESFGMINMTRAKNLMQKVWETGQPWESLVSGEFLG